MWPVMTCWLNEWPSAHLEHSCDVAKVCHLFKYFFTIKSIGILLENIIGLNFSVIQNGEIHFYVLE